MVSTVDGLRERLPHDAPMLRGAGFATSKRTPDRRADGRTDPVAVSSVTGPAARRELGPVAQHPADDPGCPGDSDAMPRSWTVRDFVIALRSCYARFSRPRGRLPDEPSLAAQLSESPRRVPRATPCGTRLVRSSDCCSSSRSQGSPGSYRAAATLEMALGSGDGPRDGDVGLDVIRRAPAPCSRSDCHGDLATRRVWQVIDRRCRHPARRIPLRHPHRSARGFDAIDEYDCREWLL